MLVAPGLLLFAAVGAVDRHGDLHRLVVMLRIFHALAEIEELNDGNLSARVAGDGSGEKRGVGHVTNMHGLEKLDKTSESWS
jgi:hypothetical protein